MIILYPAGLRLSLPMLTCLLVMALCCLPGSSARADDPAELCRAAIPAAAAAAGVPEEVLLAIALTESGRDSGRGLAPWPWTVNTGDTGHWFPDRDSATRFAKDLIASGRRSFDIGCFQINLRWHGQAFASVDQMFDPEANARYAADFLSDLADGEGGWSAAAGAYHSRTPDVADRYRARFDRILADLGDVSPPLPAPRDEGGYSHPLLQARDAPRTPGSLVPLTQVPAT